MNEETLVPSLATASLHGGLFVLAVGLVAVTFRRLPPWVRAWLWWIACAQFLVRLFLTVPIPVAVPTPQPEPVARTESRSVPSPVARHVVVSSTPVAAAMPPPPRAPSPEAVLAIVWGVGVMIGVAIAGYRLIGARRLIRHATPVEDTAAKETLRTLLGPHRPLPRLLESPEVKCALLAGYLRPSIVLPSGLATGDDPEELGMALAHEAAHLRRGDQWLTLAVTSVQILFFFHPLVWLAAREAALSREEAADLDALRLSGANPAAYAHFLLRSAQGRTPVAALGAAYGYRNLRRRITMLKIANPASPTSRTPLWKMLIAAGIGAALPWSVVAQSTPSAAAPAPARAPSVTKAPKPAAAPRIAKAKRPAKASPAAKPAKSARAVPAPRPGQALNGTVAAPAQARPVADPTVAVARPGAGQPARAVDPSVMPGGTPAQDVAPAAIPGMPGGGLGGGMPGGGIPGGAGSASEDAVAIAGMGGGGAPVAAQAGNDFAATMPKTVFDVRVDRQEGVNPLERNTTAKLVRADLEGALVKLLSEAGVNFVIKVKIVPEAISCGFTDTPVVQVLSAILAASDQNLTYRIEKGAIFIVAQNEK